jgi:hypothetical protein
MCEWSVCNGFKNFEDLLRRDTSRLNFRSLDAKYRVSTLRTNVQRLTSNVYF